MVMGNKGNGVRFDLDLVLRGELMGLEIKGKSSLVSSSCKFCTSGFQSKWEEFRIRKDPAASWPSGLAPESHNKQGREKWVPGVSSGASGSLGSPGEPRGAVPRPKRRAAIWDTSQNWDTSRAPFWSPKGPKPVPKPPSPHHPAREESILGAFAQRALTCPK